MVNPIVDLGGRLDQIEKELERIRRLYDQTIRYKLDDPETCLMHARKAAEAICRQLFTKEISKNPGNLTLEGFIEKLNCAGVLPKRIVVPLRTIQGYGNLAAHEQEEDSQNLITTEYIQPCLQALATVVDWYFSENSKAKYLREASAANQAEKDISKGVNVKKGGEQTTNETISYPAKSDARSENVSVEDYARLNNLHPATVIRMARDVLKIELRTPAAILTVAQTKLLNEHLQAIKEAKADEIKATVKTIDLGEGLTLDLVLIPCGVFYMGSPPDEEGHNDDEVQHEVEICKPFYMGRHPVTQEQYQRIVGSVPSYFQGLKLPVEMVSWFDSISFCEMLETRLRTTFRLPTEGEWEYACRAGTKTAFSFGATITTEQANYDGKFTFGGGSPGTTRWSTTPVCSFPPNAWGLFDMHGNVWEWCSDWYGEYEKCKLTDPQGPSSGDIRIFRGGSWFHGPADARSAQRDALDPGRRHSLYGFRVVMEL